MRILMNCFDYLLKAYSPYLPDDTFSHFWITWGNKYPLQPPRLEKERLSPFNFWYDHKRLKHALRKGELDDYDVIHINNWFNFSLVNYKKPHQIWIAQSHGVHLGLQDRIAISQSKGVKKCLAWLFAPLISRAIKKHIRKFDLYLVAIPNALPYAQKIRNDAIWMPNPVQADPFFKGKKPKKLSGGPHILLASRLHPIKNPRFAFCIFEEVLQAFPQAKLHLIKYGSYSRDFAQEGRYATLLDRHERRIVWHDLMPKKKLAGLYAQMDLVIGSVFPKTFYANLNLVELEAMAAGTPVVAHDRYEFIKKPLEELPGFAVMLLKDRKLREDYVRRARAYVEKNHKDAALAKRYQQLILEHKPT